MIETTNRYPRAQCPEGRHGYELANLMHGPHLWLGSLGPYLPSFEYLCLGWMPWYGSYVGSRSGQNNKTRVDTFTSGQMERALTLVSVDGDGVPGREIRTPVLR